MENLNTDIKYAIGKYREWLKIAGIILENKLISIDDEIIENFEMVKNRLSEMENIIGV